MLPSTEAFLPTMMFVQAEALKEFGYYDLSENKQVPQQPPLKRNQIYTLEPIFEEAKNYICAAGFDIFLKKKAETEEAPQPQTSVGVKTRRQPFKFSMIGLKPGDVVYFEHGDIPVTVVSENTVSYNNETYTLSRFCKHFMPEEGSENKEYQGPAHFTLNGKTLDEIRKEKE